MWRTRLFVLGCFAHDSQSALTAVYRLALVLCELNLHIYFRVVLDWLFGMEVHIARFADGKGNRGALHDSEIALWHGHQFPTGRQTIASPCTRPVD